MIDNLLNIDYITKSNDNNIWILIKTTNPGFTTFITCNVVWKRMIKFLSESPAYFMARIEITGMYLTAIIIIYG